MDVDRNSSVYKERSLLPFILLFLPTISSNLKKISKYFPFILKEAIVEVDTTGGAKYEKL